MIPSTTKPPDKTGRSDVRKQRIRADKIIWPVAPDGYIPNSVVRGLAPYPKFNRPTYCANKGLHLGEEDKTHILTKQLDYLLTKQFSPIEEQESKDGLEDGIQSVPEETNIREPFQSDVSVETKPKFTPVRRGAAQRPYFLQNRQKLLQQNAVEEHQTNSSSLEDVQTIDSSVEELQTNVPPVDELKKEEDGEKEEDRNSCPSKRAKRVKKGKKARVTLPDGLSLQQKEEERDSSIKEPEKSFQGKHVPEMSQKRRRKTNFSSKKLKSFEPALLPMRDRRPASLLMYLYKRSKAESSDGVKRSPEEAWTTIIEYKN